MTDIDQATVVPTEPPRARHTLRTIAISIAAVAAVLVALVLVLVPKSTAKRPVLA
jgi:hypothetical protein